MPHLAVDAFYAEYTPSCHTGLQARGIEQDGNAAVASIGYRTILPAIAIQIGTADTTGDRSTHDIRDWRAESTTAVV